MNDDTPTMQLPDDEDRPDEGRSAEPLGPEPRRLTRASGDRVLLGVAGGLGRYFGIDPLIFRIGFAISIFFGGLGGLAYLLLAIFVPTDSEPDRAQRFGRRLKRMGFWRGLGMVAVAAAAVVGLFALAGSAAFAVGLGWGVPVAIAIIAIGAILTVFAFRGGTRWLILPAVALAIGAGTAAATDLDLSGGIGERQYRPVTAASIPADGYELGVGRLVVDLRDVDWSRDRVVHLKVDLGIGQADVFVPERVCVAGSTHTGIGESEVAGERNDGVDVDHDAAEGATAMPRLVIDATVDVGQLRVVNSDTADVDDAGYGYDRFDEDSAPLRAAETSACATG
jgi:phage shock protein PspC (stress-responsive transcriptional regulator)